MAKDENSDTSKNPIVKRLIEDIEIILGLGGSTAINLEVPEDEYFIDPNGRNLTYMATSSNTLVANTFIVDIDSLSPLKPNPNGNAIFIEYLGKGTATITLSADNGDSGKATMTFKVTIK